MDQKLFENIVYDLRDNVDKKTVSTTDYHLDYPSMTLKHVGNGIDYDDYHCAEASVRSQLLGLVNSGVKIHLGSSLNNLFKGDSIVDPVDKFNYDPTELADELLRYCELKRQKNVYVLNHKTSGNALGIVSGTHKITQDADIYELYQNFFAEIPHTAEFRHNYFRMMINVTLDEMELELEDGNSMKLRINLGNSMFGVGSAFIRIGSWEKVCQNGMMGWRSKLNKVFDIAPIGQKPKGVLGTGVFDWRMNHTYQPSKILEEMSDGIMKQLTYGGKYIDAMERANEANEPLFKKNTKIEEALTKEKFKLTKNEAAEAYKLMIHKHKQYGRKNAFDVGRAIAEVARDTASLDRRIELEIIAGNTMLLQVA